MTGVQITLGEQVEQRRDLSQFYTSPELAIRLWRWMWEAHAQDEPITVLEPSAGRGALLRAMIELEVPVDRVVAYDIDQLNTTYLAIAFRNTFPAFEVRGRDFLADPEPGEFDFAVVNTPFEDNQDVAFADRYLRVARVCGGIFASRILHSEGRAEFWRWTDIYRMVVLSRRPHFGGQHSARTDFCLLDLRRRAFARRQGQPTITQMEWW